MLRGLLKRERKIRKKEKINEYLELTKDA